MNQKIKKVTEDEKKAKEENDRQFAEDTNEIAEKKRTLNEVEVEAKLSIMYYESQIKGAQSCADRLYKKTETKME